MAFSIRKLSKRMFIMANAVVAFVFLLACLQPWLNPEQFWIIGFLSLTIPYLVLLLLAFVVFWMLLKPRFIFISLLALLLGYRQIGALLGFVPDPFVVEKKDRGTLRMLTWNLRSFGGVGRLDRKAKLENARKIFELIKKYNPDVVVFQEFGQYDQPDIKRDNIAAMKKIGYDNYVLSKDYSRVTFGYSSGLAIFSKKEIIRKKRIQFTSSPESLLYADILWQRDTVRIFTSHLQSFKFAERDYLDLETIKNSEEELLQASRNIFSKMKRAFRNRGQQADQVRPWLDSSHRPVLFGGDLNDVPGSYAYWQLRNDRQDAFLRGGLGIGRTYMDLAPTLRIDYIFADDRFEIMQCTTIDNQLSDHLPVVADLKLVKQDDAKVGKR